ncbi:response regulator transcription factor [Enterococcus gilvus]|uniref:response regulator transcription factor n=1 Tax=Enterococcus gilvus TaxID=160453 RepID=UPI003ED9D750
MKTILLVEDDEQLLAIASSFLTEAGYAVLEAKNGVEGYEKWKNGKIDILITDVMMPKMDGFALVELIRMDAQNIPILMLTALGGEDDEVKGLGLGVDDYIQKPFSYKVLLKRIENILHRNVQISEEVLICGDIRVFPDSYIVTKNGQEVKLTKKEFDILVILMCRKNKPVTRETIIEQVWGYVDDVDTTLLNSHLKNLRQKLSTENIQTIRGVGYKIFE